MSAPPPARQEKMPPSWALAAGSWGMSQSQPQARLRVPSWRGTFEISQPSLSVYSQERTQGGCGCPRSQSPGGEWWAQWKKQGHVSRAGGRWGQARGSRAGGSGLWLSPSVAANPGSREQTTSLQAHLRPKCPVHSGHVVDDLTGQPSKERARAPDPLSRKDGSELLCSGSTPLLRCNP